MQFFVVFVFVVIVNVVKCFFGEHHVQAASLLCTLSTNKIDNNNNNNNNKYVRIELH